MDPATRRRGSWARAFDKVRAAMKRRSSSTRNLQLVAPLNQESAVAEVVARPTEPANLVAAPPPALRLRDDDAKPAPVLAAPAPPETFPDTIPMDTGVQVDADDDADEPLLPMYTSRTGITEEKAKDLFAKFGLQYEARSKRPQLEPPNKVRRVEKPVRLRVHWTCHECRTQFGIEKTCASCGHRRCRDCPRHPPKRVKELMDATRQQMEAERSQQQPITIAPAVVPRPETPLKEDPDLQLYRGEPAAAVQPEVVAGSSAPKGPPRTPPSVPGDLLSQPPTSGDLLAVEDPPLAYGEPTIFVRPSTAVVFKSKSQIVRRICHKCDAQILPASRGNCSNCGHGRCSLCPRYPPKKDQVLYAEMKAAREPAPMVHAVQRVYRKPRQRVRYTCESCNTLFIDSDRCAGCGHERCEACHRDPPRRVPRTFDPEVLRAVENHLASYSSRFEQPRPSITASAG